MAVEIQELKNGRAVFTCNTTSVTFGPVASDVKTAEAFQTFVLSATGRIDLRRVSTIELGDLWDFWCVMTEEMALCEVEIPERKAGYYWIRHHERDDWELAQWFLLGTGPESWPGGPEVHAWRKMTQANLFTDLHFHKINPQRFQEPTEQDNAESHGGRTDGL